MNDDQPKHSMDQGPSTPRPDPTVLTTRQLIREIDSVREICGKDKEIIETRLLGNDRAIELLEKEKDRIPELISNAVRQLKELHAEKFASIGTQFVERDTRTEQTSRDSKVAVDAALSAQKEAAGAQNESIMASIAKSEAAFTKQIDQQQLLIQQRTSALDDKIEDLKGRVNNNEGQTKGSGDAWGIIIGVVIGVGGLLIAIAAIAVNFIK